MSTNRSFQAMLNEFLPNSLLKEEAIKRIYLFQKVEKDDSWKGGNLVVPFKGAQASSVAFGGLTASTDVSKSKFVRGGVSYYKEVWGTMLFEHKDLLEHDGKVNEDSFLKILPDEIDDFMDYVKQVVSVQLLRGPHFAKFTADGTAGGVVAVDRIDYFTLDQKVMLEDGNTANTAYYVIAIDINANAITVSATRGGAAANVSAYTVAQDAKVYHDGVDSTGANAFSSLKAMLLPASNAGISGAGLSSLYGVSKLAYPYLQSVFLDGAAGGFFGVAGLTTSNVLDCIFDAYVRYRQIGKGDAREVLMSYKWFGAILKKLENTKGPYNIVQGSRKVSVYGWDEIEITGVKGTLKMTAINEMEDDFMIGMDWRALKFYSNGMFRKRTAPDGKQYFEVRNTTGYQYLLDISLFGELVLERPSYCFIIGNIA